MSAEKCGRGEPHRAGIVFRIVPFLWECQRPGQAPSIRAEPDPSRLGTPPFRPPEPLLHLQDEGLFGAAVEPVSQIRDDVVLYSNMRFRILYHDRCFDGACSAALFASFVKRSLAPAAHVEFAGLFHRSDQLFDEDVFGGDLNAIVDFKYSPSDRVNWWFDHHQSAFLSGEDAAHFRSDQSGTKFYAPDYKSCTKLIADKLGSDFGFDSSHLSELVHWADILDGAQHASARDAVLMESSALQLNLLLEAAEPNLTLEVIPLLECESLDAIAGRPRYKAVFRRLYERHRETISLIHDLAEFRSGVVNFDLIDSGLRGYNKFIPYYLFPESMYTVSVLDGGFRVKVSVGSNPWAPEFPSHNLARLCERYGGGGHPRVGAISLGPNEFDRARSTAREIIQILSAP